MSRILLPNNLTFVNMTTRPGKRDSIQSKNTQQSPKVALNSDLYMNISNE